MELSVVRDYWRSHDKELNDEIFQTPELCTKIELTFQQHHTQTIRDDIESVRRKLKIGGIVAIDEILEIIRLAIRQHPKIPWDQDDSQIIADDNSMSPSSISHFKNIFISKQFTAPARWIYRRDAVSTEDIFHSRRREALEKYSCFKELFIDQNEIPDIYAIAYKSSWCHVWVIIIKEFNSAFKVIDIAEERLNNMILNMLGECYKYKIYQLYPI